MITLLPLPSPLKVGGTSWAEAIPMPNAERPDIIMPAPPTAPSACRKWRRVNGSEEPESCTSMNVSPVVDGRDTAFTMPNSDYSQINQRVGPTSYPWPRGLSGSRHRITPAYGAAQADSSRPRRPVGATLIDYQGSGSPLLCQKVPVVARVSASMRSAMPAAASSGEISPPKLTMRVCT